MSYEKKIRALAFGEVLWDIYTDGEYLGGAPLNFSAHFKRCGGEAWLLSAVGNDDLGKRALCEIERLGIGTEYISE